MRPLTIVQAADAVIAVQKTKGGNPAAC